MTNPVQPQACEILSVKKESRHEWTFRVATDAKPAHGQFMQLSIPMIGEAPISVSAQGDGWLEFTIRSVGKVTNVIFEKEAGDTLFLRGPYGKGWPGGAVPGQAPGGHHRRHRPGPRPLHAQHAGGGPRALPSPCTSSPASRMRTALCSTASWRPGRRNSPPSMPWDNDAKEGWRTGLVTTFVKEIPFDSFDGDYAVVVVGPPPMMKFTGLELMNNGVDAEKVWMSFERKMSCAVGKCGHCRIDEVYVCLDGPVFPYTVARDLVD